MSDAKLGLQDSASSSTDFHVLRFLTERVVNKLSTATLVQVKAVSNTPGQLAAVGTVDVLPLVNQLTGDGTPVKHQVVHALPYFRFQGGSNAVLCDPQVGDIGLAVFCHNDISQVKANKAQANPGSRRKFDHADGVYFGLCVSGTPNQYIAFTNNGISIVDKNGNRLDFSSSGIKMTGKLEVTDDTTLDKKLTVTSDTTVQNINIQGTESGGGST